MDYFYTIILAIIQGFAEFLPISSSGHLMLAERIFSLKDTSLLFELTLNLGTLLALIAFFFKEFISILDIRKKENRWLIIYIIGATIVTVVIGLILRSFTDRVYSLGFLAIGFFITSLILYSTKNIKKQDQSLNVKKSLWIGFVQGLSALPGISRSGTTISMGRHLGLNHEKAFLFSFMLSVPVGLGAIILELSKLSGGGEHVSLSLTHYLLGLMVSFIVGLLSLKLFYKLYISIYFYRFAYYCLAIGVITLILRLVDL